MAKGETCLLIERGGELSILQVTILTCNRFVSKMRLLSTATMIKTLHSRESIILSSLKNTSKYVTLSRERYLLT